MITITDIAREQFEQERRRQGRPNLAVRISFLYGCGGAGFRVAFTDDLSDSQVLQEAAGIRIGLDTQSRDALRGAVIDWEAGPWGGFLLRHPDAALVEFC
jgi:Fe-S cluster assembly iron-binding protein IscA